MVPYQPHIPYEYSHIKLPPHPVQMGKRAGWVPTCQPPVLIPIIVYVQYAEITDFTYVTGLFDFSRCPHKGGSLL